MRTVGTSPLRAWTSSLRPSRETTMASVYTALLTLIQPVRDRFRSDHGIEAIEYALIAALLAAIVVAVIALLNPAMTNIFTAIATQLQNAATSMN